MPTKRVILDAGPLGRLARRSRKPADLLKFRWLESTFSEIFVSEVSDYEVRRSLILHGLSASIGALDDMGVELGYLSISTPVMRRAAELWAMARKAGRSSAAPLSLDADVILAAQAQLIGARIVTENVHHLSRLTNIIDWSAIQ